MRRLVLPLIAVFVAVGFAALIIFGVSNTGDDRSLDQAVQKSNFPPAPKWTQQLPKLGGGTSSLSNWKGHVTVLNIWASWCPPCRDEGPLLERAQQAIAPKGATVVGVTWNDSIPDAKAFADKAGMTYPELRDVDGTFARAWGTKGLPETFILDRNGKVLAISRGQVNAKWLNDNLSPLLGPVSIK